AAKRRPSALGVPQLRRRPTTARRSATGVALQSSPEIARGPPCSVIPSSLGGVVPSPCSSAVARHRGSRHEVNGYQCTTWCSLVERLTEDGPIMARQAMGAHVVHHGSRNGPR